MLKRKGSTIIEVLIASFILTIGVMGYTASQMKTMFEVTNSGHLTFVSTMSTDFASFYLNKVYYSKKEDKEIVKGYYKNSNYWDSNNNPQSAKCTSETDLDNENKCTEENMANYKIAEYKKVIQDEIPTAEFDLDVCSSSPERTCLIVAWNGASKKQNECKTNTMTCYYLEM